MILDGSHKQIIKKFILKNYGINVSDDRLKFLDSDFVSLIKKHHLKHASKLIEKIREEDPEIVSDLLDIITINETLFMRDIKFFQLIQKTLLKDILDRKAYNNNTIKIWSAACATGQEAYSLAISLLEERVLLEGYKIEIIATDISRNAISVAKRGIYNQFEVQRGLPATMLIKYFEKISEFDWKVKESVKELIHFSTSNLIEDNYTETGFDIILCRNVLIYFNEDTKKHIFLKMHNSLEKSGYFLLGSAETQNLDKNLFIQDDEHRSLFKKF